MGKATRTCEHNTSYIESAQVMFPKPYGRRNEAETWNVNDAF